MTTKNKKRVRPPVEHAYDGMQGRLYEAPLDNPYTGLGKSTLKKIHDIQTKAFKKLGGAISKKQQAQFTKALKIAESETVVKVHFGAGNITEYMLAPKFNEEQIKEIVLERKPSGVTKIEITFPERGDIQVISTWHRVKHGNVFKWEAR